MLKNLGGAILATTVAVILGMSFAIATQGDGSAGVNEGGIEFEVADPPKTGGDASSGNGQGSGNGATPVGGRSPFELCMKEYNSEFMCTTIPPLTPGGDPAQDPPNIPDAGQLAQSAKGRIDFKAPRIGLSPVPPSPALVNLQTWLWLDAVGWAPLEGSVTAGDTTVTATARPVSVRWNMGEGLKVCQGPGTPWRKGLGQNAETTCGFTYRHTSVGQPGGAFRISATVMYDSSWTCEGECTEDGGELGMLPSPAAATNLRVTERQTVVE